MHKLLNKANSLTTKPGVYLMKSKEGKIIYVGKAKNLKNRVTSYFRKNSSHNLKVMKMVESAKDFDFIVTDNEFEALVLECGLIKQYNPRYNILLKDDKGYNYIKISSDLYPKITAVKRRDADGEYIGPYTSGFTVKNAVDGVNKAFMLPTCKKTFNEDFKYSAPCLNYQIKQCFGLCRLGMSADEYKKIINNAKKYLKNGNKELLSDLREEMQACSDALEFEQAAQIRDRIAAITKITGSQNVVIKSDKSIDAISIAKMGDKALAVVLLFRHTKLVDKQDFYLTDILDPDRALSEFITRYYTSGNEIPSIVLINKDFEGISLVEEYLSKLAQKKITVKVPQKGELKALVNMSCNNAQELLLQKLNYKKTSTALIELGELLGLQTPPLYIEAYDISSWGDDNIVGGMIVFKDGKPYKKSYRRFKINQYEQDDYKAMREMLTRRFSRYKQDRAGEDGFGKLPDLVLVDGAKGHVSVAHDVLSEFDLNIPVFGMIKDHKHRTRAIAKEGGEIEIKSNRAVFTLITGIQDEAHRFAITYQKKLSDKKLFK